MEKILKTKFYFPDVVCNEPGKLYTGSSTSVGNFIVDSILPRLGLVETSDTGVFSRAEDESIQRNPQPIATVYHNEDLDIIRKIQEVFFKRFGEPLRSMTYEVTIMDANEGGPV